MAGAQRRKGIDFERLVARLLREAGFDARTARQAAPLADHQGLDIICPGLPFCIQAKAGRKVRPARALKEASGVPASTRSVPRREAISPAHVVDDPGIAERTAAPHRRSERPSFSSGRGAPSERDGADCIRELDVRDDR